MVRYQEGALYCGSGETLKQIAQGGYGLPVLGVLKARLGQTLSKLVWWEVSLHTAGRQGQYDLEGPSCAEGHFSLDWVAQSSIQSGFKHIHGWGIHNSSGQATLTTKNFLLISNLYLLSFNLFPLIQLLHVLVKSPSASLQAPFRYGMAAVRSPLSCLFSRIQILSPFPSHRGEVLHASDPSDHLSGFPWTL